MVVDASRYKILTFGVDDVFGRDAIEFGATNDGGNQDGIFDFDS